MQNKLFKKSSVERFSSPEKLNDYIKVSNPSSWMVLGAALALLIGVLVWGFFGELTEEESFTGIVRQGVLECYVSSPVSAALEENMEVTVAPLHDLEGKEIVTGRVLSIGRTPLSYDEATEGLGNDYLLATLGISTWNIAVTVVADAPLYEDVVYTVVAVTDTQRPIDLIFQ